MATIITTYKTACKLWNKTNRPEQPWLAGWMAAFRHKTIWEPDWRNASEAAVAVTTHERIRLCVLSPLYLMVMDKLSVAYHLTLWLGVWCFSRVSFCWVDRFGLLIAVWWFWYVCCVEQVKSFMQWRLQIAFSCPSPPPPPIYSSGSFDVWINQYKKPEFLHMLLLMSHCAQFLFLLCVALYHIFSTQNEWHNYKSLLSLTQANYSVIKARISYAHSLLLTLFVPFFSGKSCKRSRNLCS